MFRQFSWLVPFSLLKLLMVMMVFFITYLLWKADRLLEGEIVLSESGFAGRLLAVVCENGVLYVPMKMAVLNEACVFVGRNLSGIVAELYYYFKCTRRARVVKKGRGWDKYKDFFVFRCEK